MSKALELSLEHLENRKMLAGDVSVSVTNGGDLIIIGDSADNQLVVTSTEPNNQFHVAGLNGTTINGQESLVVNGVVDDMRINLRGGDNAILLSAHNEYNYSNRFEVDDIRFNSAGGNDIVALQQVVVTGDFRAVTGGGNDLVVVTESDIGAMRAITAGGDDALLINDSDFTDPTVAITGAGDDTFVSVDNEYQDDARIRLGGGQDFAATSADNFQEDLSVSGGGGQDDFVQEGGTRQSEVQGSTSITSFASNEVVTGLELLGRLGSRLQNHQASNEYFELFADYLA